MPPLVPQTGPPGTMKHAVIGGGAASFFFLALASPVAAEPSTKAAAVTAINAAYPRFLSFTLVLPTIDTGHRTGARARFTRNLRSAAEIGRASCRERV